MKWNELNKKDLYRFLDRMKGDCMYYLGVSGHCDKALWAGNPQKQLDNMQQIINIVGYPEWLTRQEFNSLKNCML